MKTYRNLLLIALMVVTVTACKKNKDSNTSESDKIKDTTIAYARDIYLWYDKIPASFNARNYSSPDAIMKAIRAYSNEPGFSTPVDRWSFAVDQAEWDDVSGGIAKDFGLNAFFYTMNDLRVRLVEPNSPAGMAGIKRGWRFTKVNGITDINTSRASELQTAIYGSNTASFTFLKPDGASVDITLNAASYNSKPLYLDSVYTVGAKKVGYMVYNSFLGDSAQTVDGYARIINRFTAENVDDVIIDLRYNGGGYVYFQQVLANYLAPNSANGGLMMATKYNNNYSRYNSSVNFSKKGTLNLSRIFFIVSNSTASASELLINNLKPYISNVHIIGPSKTYGKPVGYFPIPVGTDYIFPVSSRTVNKNNEGNYFDGFALSNQVLDGLTKELGDVDELCLASALKYIGTGSFRVRTVEEPFTEIPQVVNANKKLDHSFKGMINPQRF
ncbi:S41 family peptidase [Terrimonas rubra]|uniref:S41 family peptidase n=1 Tax=Terrimonas rubra TaxID=1035890 RepID=A0ABW6A2F5_9BACT